MNSGYDWWWDRDVDNDHFVLLRGRPLLHVSVLLQSAGFMYLTPPTYSPLELIEGDFLLYGGSKSGTQGPR